VDPGSAGRALEFLDSVVRLLERQDAIKRDNIELFSQGVKNCNGFYKIGRTYSLWLYITELGLNPVTLQNVSRNQDSGTSTRITLINNADIIV